MALENSKINKVGCTKWAINESCRPNELLSECTNRILIGLQMTEKTAKYARSRSSFTTNRNETLHNSKVDQLNFLLTTKEGCRPRDCS
jgi:hypothetical protein